MAVIDFKDLKKIAYEVYDAEVSRKPWYEDLYPHKRAWAAAVGVMVEKIKRYGDFPELIVSVNGFGGHFRGEIEFVIMEIQAIYRQKYKSSK